MLILQVLHTQLEKLAVNLFLVPCKTIGALRPKQSDLSSKLVPLAGLCGNAQARAALSRYKPGLVSGSLLGSCLQQRLLLFRGHLAVAW